MKRKLFITTGLLCCCIAAFAYFAGIDGHWKGSLLAPDGNEYPLDYTFKTDGNKLTGSGQSPNGAVNISDGKISSDSLSFAIDVGGVKILNKGKYFSVGDSIGLNIDYEGMLTHATLKRAIDK